MQVANQLDLSYDGRSANVRGSSRFHQVLRQKPLYLLALFSLLYVGVEMTIGGKLESILMVCFVNNRKYRLDRLVHHPIQKRRPLVGLYIVRILWRCVTLRLSVESK